MTFEDRKIALVRKDVIREIAKNLVKLDVSTGIIHEATGLSYDEIDEIQQKFGNSKERRRIAKNLLEFGVSVDIIQQTVGLSNHEIDDIQNELTFEKTCFR